MSIIDTLITDRTAADTAALEALFAKAKAGSLTEEERAILADPAHKGAYNHTDLNRVTAAMEYLANRLREYGYIVNYVPVEIQRPELPSWPVVGTPLNDFTWKEISEISKSGKAATYWEIGDTKTIDFGGTTFEVQIIGFDHDDVVDAATYGRNKAGITFQFGVANDSSKYGVFGTYYPINSSATNVGGWANSVMRNTTMPLMNGYMPTDLQSVLVAVNKLTSAGGGSATINTTADKLFLLSVVELFGTATYSFPGEGTQYAFYSAGNSKVRYRGSAAYWWTRSPNSTSGNYVCFVGTGGAVEYQGAGNVGGVSFAFCV